MFTPIIFNCDSYKYSHWLGYLPGFQNEYSYICSRGIDSEFLKGYFDKPEDFQIYLLGVKPLIDYIAENPVWQEEVDEAEAFCAAHGEPFNKEMWQAVIDEYDGYLPLRIYALPEGTLAPIQVPLVTVEATDERFASIASHIETFGLRGIWYPTTVATQCMYMKRFAEEMLEKTAMTKDSLPFALLDFSARGCTSNEANMLGGMGYLSQFKGSDSVAAVRYVNRMYGVPMSGYSVPATQHSIMCALPQTVEEFKALIDRMSSKGHKIVSVVSDTWNIYEACEIWAEIAPYIKSKGVTLVVRPDSGNPYEQLPKIFETLAKGFGFIINDKGYKVLDGVKVLWCDGIDTTSFRSILQFVAKIGYSTECIILGSGGGLMQKVTRDSLKVAMKASANKTNGIWTGIAKDPITDPGKKSLKGLVYTRKDENGKLVVDQLTQWEVDKHEGSRKRGEMYLVYENGQVYEEYFDINPFC